MSSSDILWFQLVSHRVDGSPGLAFFLQAFLLWNKLHVERKGE